MFYTSELSATSFAVAAVAAVLMFIMNRRGVLGLTPYILVGIVMWAAVLKSGVHATLAGVVTAMFIPFVKEEGEQHTQLEKLEHDLHPVVAYAILPLFAFANAGIPMDAINIDTITHPIPMAIALGLFIGNQVGVFGLSWLAVKLGLAKMPSGATWLQVYGVACLCGIGFTMSLFIGSLAFEDSGQQVIIDERFGIVTGSLASGLIGYLILRFSSKSYKAVE